MRIVLIIFLLRTKKINSKIGSYFIIERFLSGLGSRIFTFGNVSRDTSLVIRQSGLIFFHYIFASKISFIPIWNQNIYDINSLMKTLRNVNIRGPSHDNDLIIFKKSTKDLLY